MRKEAFFLPSALEITPPRSPSEVGCIFFDESIDFGRPYSVFGVYEGPKKAIIAGRSRANRNEDPAPGRVLSVFGQKL